MPWIWSDKRGALLPHTPGEHGALQPSTRLHKQLYGDLMKVAQREVRREAQADATLDGECVAHAHVPTP